MTPQEINSLKVGDVLGHKDISFLYLIAGLNDDNSLVPQDKKFEYSKYTIEEVAKYDGIVENILIRNNENRCRCVYSRYNLQYNNWKLISKHEEEEML
jgi:hypothetical protein